MACLMKRRTVHSIAVGLALSLPGGSLLAQTAPVDPGSGTSPDPIAIVTAHILKGQTNSEQRKTIRLEWLSVASQQAEDLLRTAAFQRIIEFIQKNHDLFASIYAGLKTANGAVATGKRVKDVFILQRTLLLRFADTGQLLTDTEYFTADELRHFTGVLDQIMEDTEANFQLIIALFRGGSDAQLTDLERFEVLKTIEQRLLQNVQAVSQLNRYITYLNTNRAVQRDGGLEMFTQPR